MKKQQPKAGLERKETKSLRLHKETLQRLEVAQLEQAAGGQTISRCYDRPCDYH